MRILLAGTRGAGHIGPLIPFALACRRAGHDVLMAAPRSAWEHVARAHLPFAGVDDPLPEVLDPLWERVRTLPREQADQIVLEKVFAGAFARAALPGMLAVMRRWRPDVVVRETGEFASLVAAEALEIPAVRVECFLGALAGVDWEWRAPLAPLRLECGLRGRAREHWSGPYL